MIAAITAAIASYAKAIAGVCEAECAVCELVAMEPCALAPYHIPDADGTIRHAAVGWLLGRYKLELHSLAIAGQRYRGGWLKR